MRTLPLIAAIASVSLLAGCGYNQKDRAEGGAATGAATGAAIGLIGGPPGVVVGALVGGAAGAATGASTKPSQVNLGKPLWDHDNGNTYEADRSNQ